MGFSVVSVAFVVMDKSYQELLDKHMCKPGYVWNDTLKRCLAAGSPEMKGDVPAPPELEEPVSEQDPVKPKGKKPGAGPARSQSRTSATGMKQTGTAMGMSMPIK